MIEIKKFQARVSLLVKNGLKTQKQGKLRLSRWK